MHEPIIVNQVDFQRHLNGCERRLKDLSKSCRMHVHPIKNERTTTTNLARDEQNLYDIVLSLDRSSFAYTERQRLTQLKKNLQHIRSNIDHVYETIDNTDQLFDETQSRLNQCEIDLTDLKATFTDLQQNIHNQGAIIDHIGDALTDTDEFINETVDDMQTTVEHGRRSSRSKSIIIVVSTCFCLFVVLIIYFIVRFTFPFVRI
jgi:t-SNARE complex subunit (syntaxin)